MTKGSMSQRFIAADAQPAVRATAGKKWRAFDGETRDRSAGLPPLRAACVRKSEVCEPLVIRSTGVNMMIARKNECLSPEVSTK